MFFDTGGHSIDITVYKIVDEQGAIKKIFKRKI